MTLVLYHFCPRNKDSISVSQKTDCLQSRTALTKQPFLLYDIIYAFLYKYRFTIPVCGIQFIILHSNIVKGTFIKQEVKMLSIPSFFLLRTIAFMSFGPCCCRICFWGVLFLAVCICLKHLWWCFVCCIITYLSRSNVPKNYKEVLTILTFLANTTIGFYSIRYLR